MVISTPTPEPEPLLKPTEVAIMLRVNPRTVTRWAKAEIKIFVRKINKKIDAMTGGLHGAQDGVAR